MNLEMPTKGEKEKEGKSEQKELTAQEKKVLAQTWVEMVVDNIEIPENIDKMENEEFKKWMYESIMQDTEKVAVEFGLMPDQELIKKINNAKDVEEKAIWELEYIKYSHAQVDILVQNFINSPDRSSKWDSWPKRIRETKEFNCVGANLFGTYFLDKAGIKTYQGNPYQHVINIVRLSNENWWYVDFRNGPKNIIKIEPTEEDINGVKVLKIDQSDIDYRLIPIYGNENLAGFVLGNLSSLEHDALDSSIPDEDVEKIEAKKYFERYGGNFDKIDFSFFDEVLYGFMLNPVDCEQMAKEKGRIEAIWNFEKPIQDFTKTLSKKQQEILAEEMKLKKPGIKDLLFKKDESIFEESSPELNKLLHVFISSIEVIQDKQKEVYEEALHKFIGKLEKL